jgi:hypothetical protein
MAQHTLFYDDHFYPSLKYLHATPIMRYFTFAQTLTASHALSYSPHAVTRTQASPCCTRAQQHNTCPKCPQHINLTRTDISNRGLAALYTCKPCYVQVWAKCSKNIATKR